MGMYMYEGTINPYLSFLKRASITRVLSRAPVLSVFSVSSYLFLSLSLTLYSVFPRSIFHSNDLPDRVPIISSCSTLELPKLQQIYIDFRTPAVNSAKYTLRLSMQRSFHYRFSDE